MSEKVFKELSAQPDPEGQGQVASEPTEIESMCVGCGENGVTKLLLTMIPHYREVIIMSFNCDHCGLSNNEIQPGSRIQEKGVEFRVRIDSAQDLSRQVVKGFHAIIKVPEIELEIPPESQKGVISTVEGILSRTIEGLTQDQPVRRHMDPEGAAQIDAFVTKIEELRDMSKPFTLILRDPSGNSFVENLKAPAVDPKREVTAFTRSKEEDHQLGIFTPEEIAQREEEEDDEPADPEDPGVVTKDEVLHFPTNCPDCNAPAETNMKVVDIPHFKEVVIMATTCDHCGHKTNEVKSGGGIEPKGTKITLRVTDPSDMSRDVLKSETCSLQIPELDFEMGGFALGGRFTTLEGLMTNVLEQVENNPFLGTTGIQGDSTTPEAKKRLEEFTDKFKALLEGKTPFIFILDDPTGNSYLQNVYAPDSDPEMTVERYERSFEQNEELGLNDMKTENYGENTALLEAAKDEQLQQAHLLEVGAKHVYTKEGANTNLLSPARAATTGGDNSSRRTSAAKSAKSLASSGANADGSSSSGGR